MSISSWQLVQLHEAVIDRWTTLSVCMAQAVQFCIRKVPSGEKVVILLVHERHFHSMRGTITFFTT